MSVDYKHAALTKKIIKCAFEVHNILGYGFIEKIYENALILELQSNNLNIEAQKPIRVIYKENNVGDYITDIIVEDKVVIEIKAVEKLIDMHEVQLKNYLKATNMEVGLLLNFGKSLGVKRKYVKNLEKS